MKRWIILPILAMVFSGFVPPVQAEHPADPACDGTHSIGTNPVDVVTGSVDAGDSDVWHDPRVVPGTGGGGFVSRKDFVLVADGPVEVTRWGNPSCKERVPPDCISLVAVFVCTFSSVGPGEVWVSVEHDGGPDPVEYALARSQADTSPL